MSPHSVRRRMSLRTLTATSQSRKRRERERERESAEGWMSPLRMGGPPTPAPGVDVTSSNFSTNPNDFINMHSAVSAEPAMKISPG